MAEEEASGPKIMAILQSIIFILGVSGNSIVLYVLVKCNAFTIPHNRTSQSRDRTNHNNIYLLNLSLADQMYLLCVPFVEIMPQIHKRGWTFGLTVCRITTAVDNAYQLTSIYFMAAMALDRCLVMMRSRRRTRNLTIATCASIWIILLGLASPIYHYAEVAKTECNENQTECSHRCNMNFVKYKNIPDLLLEADYRPFCQGGIIFNKMTNKNHPDCFQNFTDANYYDGKKNFDDKTIWFHETNDDYMHPEQMEFNIQAEGQKIFILVQITIGFCIPLLIIVTSYWGLTATIQKHQSEVKTQSHWKTHEQQVTRRVIIFVSAFFFCWFPFYMLRLLYNFTPWLNDRCPSFATFWYGSMALANINSCLNPILYAGLNTRFRKNACQLLLKSDEDFVLVFKTWLKNSVRSQRPIIESPATSRSLSSVYTVNTKKKCIPWKHIPLLNKKKKVQTEEKKSKNYEV